MVPQPENWLYAKLRPFVRNEKLCRSLRRTRAPAAGPVTECAYAHADCAVTWLCTTNGGLYIMFASPNGMLGV